MNSSSIACLLLLFISLNGLADTKKSDILPSGNAKLPRCEPYTGTVCKKYVKNELIYVEPQSPPDQLEGRMQIAFSLMPNYLSERCKPYAFHALCLYAFSPCDKTVNYTKSRKFCQDECKALEQHICANEFDIGRQSMGKFVPNCSRLPAPGSKEHNNCISLNVKIDRPVFKKDLKNVTASVGKPLVLKCKIKSTNIDPSITWYKDGKIIPPGHPFYKIYLFRLSSRMKIRRIHMRDSGKFVCKISNVFWNVSSESWVTVVNSTDGKDIDKGNNQHKNSSCGFVDPTSVCWNYLKDSVVKLSDSKRQHESVQRFVEDMNRYHVSRRCTESAIIAMCYEKFPVCHQNHFKHRLCKNDCLKVKNEVCQNQLPTMFPDCSNLPKRSGRKGRHCDKVPEPEDKRHPRCEKYRGNRICGKYLQNDTVYMYDIQDQYQTELMFEMSLGSNFVSAKCLKFGIPGMCYHLFPVCDQGVRKPRLCKEDCEKLKTDVCKIELSFIKKISETTLKKMFPNCSTLPSDEESYCTKIDMTNKPKTTNTSENELLYDSRHECYNGTGIGYLGIHNRSVFGKPCVSWHIPQPERKWFHNFCRNPKGKFNGSAPWCYVNNEGRKEYCKIPKCAAVFNAFEGSGESTSWGRTIYVVIAIAAVLLLCCVTVIVYWKVHDSKQSLSSSPQGSAAPFAKCSSTQLNDGKESTEMKSFIMNEKMKRGRVKHTSVMGEGSFCKVYKGELVDDLGNPSMNIVIKALSEDATIMEKDTFHRETSLLCPLQHVNILGLLGVSPSEDSVFVVFEYLSETNLHQFLKLKSPQNDGDENKSLDVGVLFDIAAQIANGMKYLAEFNYIHGDVAARNCFISENEINVKISMLGVGIGSHKYPLDYGWLHQGNSLFPIRWMSPESLESLVLTSENDIWAFGVLLWEIFSFGLRPYHQYSNTEVTDKVRALELLECPQDWPNSVRNVIGDCWSVEPSMRPNFETIYDTLSNRYFNSLDKAVEVTV